MAYNDYCPVCGARLSWATPDEVGYPCGCQIDNDDRVIVECEFEEERKD